MVFEETHHRPWKSVTKCKLGKRLRRIFGCLLILKTHEGPGELYAFSQMLTNTICCTVENEVQRQRNTKSKLSYLFSPKPNGAHTKPLKKLRDQTSQSEARHLISEIVRCLRVAPYPGTTDSEEYLVFLDDLIACCVDYERARSLMY
eukprot:6186940-Karenia_brevis.AAC.1